MKPYTYGISQRIVLSLSSITIVLFLIIVSGCKEETFNYSTDDLSNPAIPPRVLFTLPGDGSTGPFELYNPAENRPHFVVQFNKLIDLTSLDPSLVTVQGFDHPVQVSLFSGYYYYPLFKQFHRANPENFQYDNVLSFSIHDSASYVASRYDIGTYYTVSIGPGIKDINGNATAQPYRFMFRPEPNFRVVEVYPEDTTTNVPVTAPITIAFNSPVNNSLYSSLRIDPPLLGTWKNDTYDSSTVRFIRLGYLPFNTSFSMTVSSDAEDRYGNHIDHGLVSNFHVTPFSVSSLTPAPGATQVSPNASILLYFTGAVDFSTIPSSITYSPAVTGSYRYGSTDVTFQPTTGLLPSTSYTVSIAGTVLADDGTPLQAPFAYSFTTAPFSVINSYPQDGAYPVSRTQTIEIWCNAQLDMPTAVAAFNITPAVNGVFTLIDGNSWFSLRPSTPLAANTIYTVTISNLLRSKLGPFLSQGITFRFKTEK